jgi:hypothetical protein
VHLVILETHPVVTKSITKKYPDGRTLSLLVVDDQLVEKSLTFPCEWNFEEIKKERAKGAEVKFQYWEKGGLEASLTYFGSFLVGKCSLLIF